MFEFFVTDLETGYGCPCETGFASVQLQGWASRNSVGYGSLQARLQRLGRSARRVKHVSVVYEKVEGQEIPGRIQCRGL